ncbi:site-specific integrase [Vibrio sp. Isolate23]|uniref:site-specific integrase n=1 Tax=Vibrio sp. Isolate23 TaxID=2908533 RepID=UPI001EFE2882|nr:site-specific integrase [Vibrio sp. Isolate23]MCG9683553.1 site-specific integrase [Vibrio sp. Isolate23]
MVDKLTIEEISLFKITKKQKDFNSTLKIPRRLQVTTDNPFDEINVVTSENSWIYRYSGKKVNLNFTKFPSEITNLLKYYVFESAQNGSIFFSENLYRLKIINSLKLSFSSYKNWLKANVDIVHPMQWNQVRGFTQFLCRIELPGFKDEDRESLLDIPPPNSSGRYLVYQNIENAFPQSTKTLIVNGIMDASSFISSLKPEQLYNPLIISDEELQDWCIFSILYFTGLRPVQLSKISVDDIHQDTIDSNTGLVRYSLSMPYAKKQKVTKKRACIALPTEFGIFFESYIKRYKLCTESPLLPIKSSIHRLIKLIIKRTLFRIQPKKIQKKITNGEFLQPYLTPIDFRHNIGHSMAMSGASADEIAYILGHAKTNAASYYILATPQLAIIKNNALGTNNAWENMINLLMTDYIIDINNWDGKKVSGIVNGKLHLHIGGCRKKSNCHLAKVRSCYGCFYFHPSSDSEKHINVIKSLESEILNTIEISEKSGNSRNPISESMLKTRIQIQIIINRINGRKL